MQVAAFYNDVNYYQLTRPEQNLRVYCEGRGGQWALVQPYDMQRSLGTSYAQGRGAAGLRSAEQQRAFGGFTCRDQRATWHAWVYPGIFFPPRSGADPEARLVIRSVSSDEIGRLGVGADPTQGLSRSLAQGSGALPEAVPPEGQGGNPDGGVKRSGKGATGDGTESSLSTEKKALASRLNLSVSDGGYFSIPSLQEFFAENLSDKTLAYLSDSPHALFVDVDVVEMDAGELYCIATVGLTEHAPGERRNTRIPSKSYSGIHFVEANGDKTDEGVRICRSGALIQATSGMAKEALELQMDNIGKTGAQGKRYSDARTDPKMVAYYINGLSTEDANEAMDIIPLTARRAFDYRRLIWVVFVQTFSFGGRVRCEAQAGVAAHPPSDRNPRQPGHLWTGFTVTPETSSGEDAKRRCNIDVVKRALRAALDSSWDKDGLLQGIELTREDGQDVPTAPPHATPERGGLGGHLISGH